MENKDYQTTHLNNVPIDDLIDSKKECNPRKILENKDNFIFNDYELSEINNKHLLSKTSSTKTTFYDSDESSLCLQDQERKILRKCKIWRCQNIKIIDLENKKKKKEDKMIIPNPVIEKIQNNEFELGDVIDKANKFIEGKCLVFYQNDCERKSLNYNENKERLSEVKNTVNIINKKMMEIDSKWKETCMKEDILVVHDDIYTLRRKSLELLNEKDNVINKLVNGLEELLSNCLIETENNSDDLMKLNEITKTKIKTLKEEHDKYNLFITKLINDEIYKKNNKDTTEWTLLMDNIIIKIINSACIRLSMLEKKNLEFKKQYEANEEYAKCQRLAMAEKNIGINADLELVKIKCSDNIIENLQYNCYILEKRIEENTLIMINRRRKMFLLQKNLFELNEKYKQIESTYMVQKLVIKKQMSHINRKIEQQKKIADYIVKRDKNIYIKLWSLHQNNIINCINNIIQIDNFSQEFLGINKKSLLCEKPIQTTINTSPLMNHINNLVTQLQQTLYTNSTSNSYEHVRDRALNKLLLDFIVTNSSFVIDNDLKEILDTNPMQNVPYIYNALSTLKLNKKEIMDLIKLKFKPFVMCIVCNSNINWKLETDLKQENCLNELSDACNKELKSTKSLFEKLCTHITRHNENIGKVKKSKFLLLMDSNDEKYSNNTENKNNYSKVVNNNNIVLSNTQCVNVNHGLYIDNKHFMPILKEIVKETRFKPHGKSVSLNQKLQKEYNLIQWKVNENDLQTYWLKFIKYIPNNVNLWNAFYKAVRRYYDALVVFQKKCLKNKALQKENQKLKQLEYQIECICKENNTS